MTSLSAQLQQLAVNVPTSKTHSEVRNSRSLLFSSFDKDALDKEVLLSLAENGLCELTTIDKRFSEVQPILFSSLGQHIESSVTDRTANEELKKQIVEYFVLLAPYIQRKCALKTLEWLLSRFPDIVTVSSEFVLMTLPCHELKAFRHFAKVIDQTNAWFWLNEYSQSGQPVTKKQLQLFFSRHVDHMLHVTNFVIKLNQVHCEKTCKFYNSFLTVTFLGVIEHKSKKRGLDDSLLSIVLDIAKKLFLADRTQLKLIAVTLLSFVLSKTLIETKVLKKLFLFICKHLDAGCHLHAFKLFLVAVSTQANFLENCGKVLSLFFHEEMDHKQVISDIQCDSCLPLTMIVKQGLGDPLVVNNESFLCFVESYFSQMYNSSPDFFISSIKDLVPAICTNPECSENWKRLVSYLATHFGFVFKDFVASLQKTNPVLADLIENEVPSFASAHKKLAKLDDARLACLMESDNEKDRGKLENFRDGLKQTFLFDKAEIVLQLFEKFKPKLLPLLGIDAVVDCFYQRSLKLISEELKNKKGKSNNKELLDAMKKFIESELSPDKRLSIEATNEINVEMKIMVLHKIYSYMAMANNDEKQMTSSRLSTNGIRDWLMSTAENALKHENWNECVIIYFVLLSNGSYVDDNEIHHSLLQRINAISSNAGLSTSFSSMKLNLKVLQNYPSELSFFESCLAIIIESRSLLQCLTHFQLENMDNIECEPKMRIALVTFLQVINCLPSGIPSLFKSIGLNPALNVLLAVLYLPKNLFDSASVQTTSQMTCWTIISKFLANAKKLPDVNLFTWPVFCGLTAKQVELRALVLDCCHILNNRYGHDAIRDYIIDRTEELKADRKYVEKVIADLSDKMPANLEDSILTARKYHSRFISAKVVPLLVCVKSNSSMNLLSSLLKTRSNETDKTSIEICCVILNNICAENVHFFFEGLLSCLVQTACAEVISTGVSILNAQVFERLEEKVRMEILVRLVNLAKYDKQLGGAVKSVMKQLPLNVATLRLCFGLPEYSADTKPRRSRVDSFSLSTAQFDRIQMFLQYLREYTFNENDAKQVTALLNSLLASLERSHIAQETNLLQSLILNTVSLLSEFLHRYSIEGTDRVDIDIVLSIIKLFDDINLRSQCFHLIMDDFCLNSHQKSTDEQCRMAIKLFTVLCESLASHEDDFSFQLIVRSIQQLLLPLCKSSKGNLDLFLPHLVQSLRMHSSQRQVLLLQTCMSVKRFKKSEYMWQLILSVFMESSNSIEVQNSVLIVCQALEHESVRLSMQCLSTLLTAADHLLGPNSHQSFKMFKLGCLTQLSEKNKRFIILQTIALIPTVINSELFVDKLAQIEMEEAESIRDYDDLFRSLLELVFKIEETLFSQNASCKSNESLLSEESGGTASTGNPSSVKSPVAEEVKSNFSKTLEVKIQGAMKAVDRLLDDVLFFEMIFNLLQSDAAEKNEHVRRALQMLNIRISRDTTNFLKNVANEKIESLYKVLVRLINQDESVDTDRRICQQVLNILTKLFQHRPMMVETIAEEMSKLLVLQVSVNIRIQIYSLVSQIVMSVKKAFLPYLGNFVSFVIETAPFRLNKNSILFESALFCISTLLQNISDLLGPHLHRVCTFLINMSEFERQYSSSTSLSMALELLSQTNWRTLVPALTTVFESLLLTLETETTELFSFKITKLAKLLNDTIEFQETASFDSMTSKLEDLFLLILNLRQKVFVAFNKSENKVEEDFSMPSPMKKKPKLGSQSGDSSSEDKKKRSAKRKHPEIDETRTTTENVDPAWSTFTLSENFNVCEKSLFEPVVSYILRRTRFAISSFLYKVHEWACNEKSPRRKMTFFHFLNFLAEQIKGLMLFFIPQYVHSFIQCLSGEQNSKTQLQSEELLFINKNIIRCLTTTMSYDVEPVFATAEKVEKLLPVILGQWDSWFDESHKHLGKEPLEDLLQNAICTCLGQLMVSCRDEDSRNTIHRKVLSYSEHDKVVIRKAVLLALRNIATRLQEEYSMFYPEAVPFLAQLKEDDNEALVMECDSTLKTIEQFVGEAVYEHFPRME